MLKKLLVLLISFFMMIPHSFVTFAENAEESEPTEIAEKEPLTVQPMADEEKDIRDISVDETVTVNIENGGDMIYYRFVPETSDKYMFVSMSDEFDTYGYLYDESFNQLTYDDEGAGNGNFRVKYQLEAGVTYYFAARMYNSEQTGSFEAKLSVYEPTAAEELSFKRDSYGMRLNSYQYIPNFLDIQPYLALEDTAFTSSDETVIKVEGNYVNANAAGEATLTATSANGISASTLIKVGNYADYISPTSEYQQNLEVGQSVELTYKLYPEDADLSDETVIWTVTDGEEYISLDQEGNVTALSPGYANVNAETSNGSIASWYIYVSEPLTSLSFRNETNYLPIGGGNHIWNYLNYEPDEAYGSALTIESSDESIIKVDGSYLYGVAKGTAEITVTSTNGLSAAGTFEIGNFADGINPKEGNIRLKVGETKQLEYILYPEDRDTSDEVIRWEIDYSNNNSFSLSETGEVTALNSGNGAVRAYIRNGGSAYYSITVYEEPTSLSFRKDTNFIGQSGGSYIWNFLEYEPSGAYGYPLTMTSSDESIVRINGGYLYGVNKGTATVTVSTESGLSTSAEFTVGDYASSIYRTGDYQTDIKVGESKQLSYQLEPYGETFEDEEITWSLSYGATNVSVDESGVVTGLRTGYAEIRATIKNGSSTYFYVHVYQDPEALSFRKSTNYLDKYYSYNVEGYLNYEPSSAYGAKLTVTSSNPEVVEVYNKQLFGRTNGTATITVTAENGVSASAEFVVGDFAASISNIEMNSIYLTPGESKQLAYQLYPENTEFADESVTWSIESDPNDAITIDSTGLVKAVKTGYAQVKAAIKNGSYANYYISVVPEPKKIAFADMNYYVAVGSSKYINNSMLIFNPAGAQWTQAEYTSSNESVMTVQDSMIRGISVGTAILTATAEEGLVAKTRIHVGNYASSIEPDGDHRRTLKVGDSVQLKYKLYGNGDYSDDEFRWQVNYADHNCIRLSDTGEVTALGSGTAQVSVKGKTGATAYFYITVADQPTSISFEQSEYTAVIGKELGIFANVTPESASYAELKWESSDSAILGISYSYNNYAYVYGYKEGTVTIKAYSATDESVYAECTVKVVPQVPATSFTIAPTATAYVDYSTVLIYSTEPFNGDPNVTVSADNDNISFGTSSSGTIYVTGIKKGTSVLTLTSADGKVTASTTITVKEGQPNMEGNWYIGHRNPTDGSIYNYQYNPAEYLFVKGESYYVDTETVYTPYVPVNRIDLAKRLTDTGLFENAFMTGYGGSDIFAYNAAHATASKAGTAEVELINGKKIKVTVIDATWLGVKTTADSSVPAEIANAFKEYDFNLQYDTTFYAAEINGLNSLSVNANQKAVVQSWLDVSIDEYEKDALGNIRFVFTADPKVKVVSMAQNADSKSNGTDLISERTLNPYSDMDVVIPTDQIFGNANIRGLKVTQKVNGTEFTYGSDNFILDDGLLVIRSENGAGQFTIVGTVSSYKDPVYTWTETADGYEVTAVAESDEGEPTITETVNAVYSVEKEALCTTTGIGVYTATFTNAVFETQTKRVTIEAIGHHEYGEPEYTWSRDNKTATAKAVCTVCGDEVTETVNTTYEVLEEPTLEEPGKGKYTAVFTNELFETQTKEVEIPSLSDKSAKDIVLDKNELTILFNASAKLNATVLPEDCEDKTVKWSSSDASIVTVDANGNVKGVKPGKATVTAETVNGLTDTCEVRVLFTDVAVSSQYFFNPVYWAVDNGITVGAGGPGKFSPTASCTREQFVTFLWRLNGEPEPKSSSNFSDVKRSDWYYKPITWAAENGITVGLNDGTGRFGVGQACTREQCVTFLHRSVGSPEPAGSMEFTDSQAGRYYYNAIKWAAGKGITVGLNDGTGRFGVGQKCTRGMLVTFLYRFDQTK